MRLSRIYTKAGDSGDTQLATGAKVAKSHRRIRCYGDVDELASFVALLYHSINHIENLKTYAQLLRNIQQELFDLGGELSFPENDPYLQKIPSTIADEQILRLEREMDSMNEHLTTLKNFILPGGSTAAAQSHICRTICRRAERELVALMAEENVRPELLRYLNRLSDWFFVFARTLVRLEGGDEILWEQKRS